MFASLNDLRRFIALDSGSGSPVCDGKGGVKGEDTLCRIRIFSFSGEKWCQGVRNELSSNKNRVLRHDTLQKSRVSGVIAVVLKVSGAKNQ